MNVIVQEDLVRSIADALQYISHYHPADFVHALRRALATETYPPAKAAIEQLLVNSRLSAFGHRPLCQDTGVVQVFVRLGMAVQWQRRDGKALCSLQALVDEAVRQAYTDPINPLRASMVRDPLDTRRNTRDNSPGIVQCELVEGHTLEVLVVAKGGGGDVKARFATLNPSDNLVEWVLAQLPGMGAGWCPPGVIGIGIGGSPEQAMLLAKQSLFAPIDIDLLRRRAAGTATDVEPSLTAEEKLRLTLHQRINALGIGVQGLGGLTTVLDVKVATAPCHAAALPIALVPNCAATRYARLTLDGSGPVALKPPSPSLWDGIANHFDPIGAKRVNVDTLDAAEVATWRSGDTLLLNGRVLTARDAAHKRLVDLLDNNRSLPVDLRGRLIYYVGPVDAIPGEAVGPAGPTTATRMDKFVEPLLAQTGLLGMIGKAERGPAATASIRRHGAAYLMAVGGAAYLLSKAITQAKVLAFEELGMEAIHEFTLENFPVTVAVDSTGNTIHRHLHLAVT